MVADRLEGQGRDPVFQCVWFEDEGYAQRPIPKIFLTCLGRAPGQDQHVFLTAHPDATTFSCCILEYLCTEVADWNTSVPVQGRDPVFQCVWFEEEGYGNPNPEYRIPNTEPSTLNPQPGNPKP